MNIVIDLINNSVWLDIGYDSFVRINFDSI